MATHGITGSSCVVRRTQALRRVVQRLSEGSLFEGNNLGTQRLFHVRLIGSAPIGECRVLQ